MRLLVICLSLGTLLWQTSLETAPNLLTLIGFITVTGLTLTRLFRSIGLPGLLGALVAGLILGETHIISPEDLVETRHLYDFALVWTGLFMSAGLTSKTLTNVRLCKGALCIYIPPLLATLAFFLSQETPISTALPLALLAGTSVILFLPTQSKLRGEIVPLSKLTTLLGVLLWMVLSLDIPSFFGPKSLPDILIDVALMVLVLEATVQVCRIVKTEISRHIALFVLVYLLAVASFDREISAFFLAFPAGVFLSFRRAHIPLLHAHSLSDSIVSFALTSFVLGIFQNSSPIASYDQTTTLTFYLIVLIASKIMGGVLAQHFFAFPAKTWLPLLPQGFLVLLCLQMNPTSLLSPDGSLHITVLLALMALAFIYPTSALLWAKIKKDPLASHRPSSRVI